MTLSDKDFNEPGAAVENPAKYHHCCVLVLNTSYSLYGAPIQSLNAALKSFKKKLMDKLGESSSSVDLCIITFGHDAIREDGVPRDGVTLVQDFAPLPKIQIPELSADYGAAPMIKAIELAMKKVEQRLALYCLKYTPHHRPWVFIFTDGTPTDENGNALIKVDPRTGERKTDESWKSLVSAFNDAYDKKRLTGYGVAVGQAADVDALKQLVGKSKVFKIDECNFGALSDFLVDSITAAVNSEGARMPLIDLPTGVNRHVFE